jgi:hypothetical protein
MSLWKAIPIKTLSEPESLYYSSEKEDWLSVETSINRAQGVVVW